MKYYGDMKSPGIGSISQLPINFNLLFDTTANKVTKVLIEIIYINTYLGLTKQRHVVLT